MNELQILTISLLMMNAAMLLMVAYLADIQREVYRAQDDSLVRLVLNRLSDAAKRQRSLKQALMTEGKKTRKETQEIKTRLTWSRKRQLAEAKREGVQS